MNEQKKRLEVNMNDPSRRSWRNILSLVFFFRFFYFFCIFFYYFRVGDKNDWFNSFFFGVWSCCSVIYDEHSSSPSASWWIGGLGFGLGMDGADWGAWGFGWQLVIWSMASLTMHIPFIFWSFYLLSHAYEWW